MRALLQRVQHANVEVDSQVIGKIGPGLLVFLGVAPGDGQRELDWLSKKVAQLRIFSDDDDKMNLSVLDTSKEVLVVSQFTLFADCKKGRRPSFQRAAKPELADQMYQAFCHQLTQLGCKVATGQFAADMKVSLLNDGPITIIVDTPWQAPS